MDFNEMINAIQYEYDIASYDIQRFINSEILEVMEKIRDKYGYDSVKDLGVVRRD